MKAVSAKSGSLSKVNVAVVGLGFMGVTHLKAHLKASAANLVAVCDSVRQPVDGLLIDPGGNVGDAKPVRLNMKRVKAYKQLDEMLADPNIDLVDLCVPTHLHAKMAIAALQAGKHVLCEKPIARTSGVAREMVQAAKKADRILMPAMCMRFWPGWSWLKELIDQETYGKVLTARFRRVSEAPSWGLQNYMQGGQSGGALFDLHVHDTDFVQYCFGRPKAVFSSGISHLSGAVDHVFTHYILPSGVPVTTEGGWLMTPKGGFSMSYTLHFEKATVDFDSTRGAEALRVILQGKAPKVIKPKGPDGYTGEIQHILKCIQQGVRPTVVTAEDGLSAVEICEAEEQSVLKKAVVPLA